MKQTNTGCMFSGTHFDHIQKILLLTEIENFYFEIPSALKLIYPRCGQYNGTFFQKNFN